MTTEKAFEQQSNAGRKHSTSVTGSSSRPQEKNAWSQFCVGSRGSLKDTVAKLNLEIDA